MSSISRCVILAPRRRRRRWAALTIQLVGRSWSESELFPVALWCEDQAVAALRDAIKAGWNELKEPDFDALRDHLMSFCLSVLVSALAVSAMKISGARRSWMRFW